MQAFDVCRFVVSRVAVSWVAQGVGRRFSVGQALGYERRPAGADGNGVSLCFADLRFDLKLGIPVGIPVTYAGMLLPRVLGRRRIGA